MIFLGVIENDSPIIFCQRNCVQNFQEISHVNPPPF